MVQRSVSGIKVVQGSVSDVKVVPESVGGVKVVPESDVDIERQFVWNGFSPVVERAVLFSSVT